MLVLDKIAHFLAEIDLLYRQRHISSQALSLKLSRAEVADYLGPTTETVSRAIGKLKKRSVIGFMAATRSGSSTTTSCATSPRSNALAGGSQSQSTE